MIEGLTPHRQKICELLLKIRKELGLSQEKYAAHIQTSRRHYRDYEEGRKLMPAPMAEKIVIMCAKIGMKISISDITFKKLKRVAKGNNYNWDMWI